MTRALHLLPWMIATTALASPNGLAHENSSTCSTSSQALTAPHPREFLKLSLDLKEVTQTTLQQTFCEEPQNFCQAVRELSPAQRIEAFASSEDSRSLMPSGFHTLRVLESKEAETQVLDSLRESTEGQEPILKQLYSGEAWTRLSSLNQSAIQTLVTHLSAPGTSTPAPVIEKIANLKLLNPFDESIPLDQRKGLLSGCGLEDDWDKKSGNSLGDFNAFATVEGYVVVCPKALIATDDEGLMLILLHEISHQIGPCLVGASILAQVKTESCEVDASVQPELSPWLDWMGRTRKLERCFHRAGLNDGKDSDWVSRILTAEVRREEKISGPKGCDSRATLQMMPSDRVQEGLISTCDPVNSLVIIQMLSAFGDSHTENQPTTKIEKIHALARTAQLKFRGLQAKIRSNLPNTNQFNEALSDVFAAQLFDRAMDRYHSARGEPATAPAPNDILAGLSALCAPDFDWKIKGNAHSRDDRRMEIFSSQPEFREAIGCQNPIPRGLPQNLSKCEGLGF